MNMMAVGLNDLEKVFRLQPILTQCSISIPPEVQKWNIG